MPFANPPSRRFFLHAATVSAAIGGTAFAAQSTQKEEVAPAEDLMREHGVLKRVMLIYDEIVRRIRLGETPADQLAQSATIIRTFIEDYHEKLEEDQLFPRFRKAGKLVDLVDTLLAQHQAGRAVTDIILKGATAQALKDPTRERHVVHAIAQFNRMYAPHEAREDTVLFPAIRQVVLPAEYDRMGDQFEDKEHELFGPNGFEKMVDRVAEIEKSLGIYDLSQFTPKV